MIFHDVYDCIKCGLFRNMSILNSQFPTHRCWSVRFHFSSFEKKLFFSYCNTMCSDRMWLCAESKWNRKRDYLWCCMMYIHLMSVVRSFLSFFFFFIQNRFSFLFFSEQNENFAFVRTLIIECFIISLN